MSNLDRSNARPARNHRTCPTEGTRLRAMRVVQAAEALGVRASTIRNWLDSGVIRGSRIGGSIFIPESEVNRIIAAIEGVGSSASDGSSE